MEPIAVAVTDINALGKRDVVGGEAESAFSQSFVDYALPWTPGTVLSSCHVFVGGKRDT